MYNLRAFLCGTSALAALGLFGTAAAHAQSTITYSAATTVSGAAQTDAFTLTGFDPTLGTLTGVSFGFTGTGTAGLGVLDFNFASTTPQGFTGSSSYTPTLTGPDATVVSLGVINSGTLTGFTQPPANPTNVAGATTNVNVSGAASSFAVYQTASPLAFTLNIPPFNSGGSQTSGSDPIGFGAADDLTTGTSSVTYTYTPNASAAPEPSQLAGLSLTALGLGGLILRAHKRRTASV